MTVTYKNGEIRLVEHYVGDEPGSVDTAILTIDAGIRPNTDCIWLRGDSFQHPNIMVIRRKDLRKLHKLLGKYLEEVAV